MGNSSSSQKISAQDRAILDVKLQRDKLQQYQKRITVLTERETAVARECLAANRRPQALVALRRKRFQESLLAKADKQLETLQVLMADIEFAQLQVGVMEGLRQGNAVLKRIHAEMGGVEGVERLLEESAEAREYVREVNEVLAGQLSASEEEEVEDELEALRGQVEGPVAQPGGVPVMPKVPLGKPVAGKVAEEERGTAEGRTKTTERQAMLA